MLGTTNSDQTSRDDTSIDYDDRNSDAQELGTDSSDGDGPADNDPKLYPEFEGLPSALITDLADLYAAPLPATEAILEMLPFGYRAALEGLGYVESNAGTSCPVRLTPAGVTLLERAHVAVHRNDQDDIEDVRDRLRRSVEALTNRE